MGTRRKEEFPKLQLPLPTSNRKSLKIMKHFLSLSVAQILYARNMLRDELFEYVTVNDIHAKVLPCPKSYRMGRSVSRMLTHAFHAMDRQYLRSLSMYLYVDDEYLKDMPESYHFEFYYHGDDDDDDDDDEAPDIDQAAEQVSELLSKTDVLMDKLLRLNKNRTYAIRFELSYREGTPFSYHPPGYKADLPVSIGTNVLVFDHGMIETHFHSLVMTSVIDGDVIDQRTVVCVHGEPEDLQRTLEASRKTQEEMQETLSRISMCEVTCCYGFPLLDFKKLECNSLL